MPEPLRLGLAAAAGKQLFTDLAGQDAAKLAETSGTCAAGRLPLLMLAPIAAAYESEICGADVGRRSTWRIGRYSPCPRADAGRYLTFLATLGYSLTVIEQSVADGEPYTGDTPDDPPPEAPDASEEPNGGAGNPSTDEPDTAPPVAS